MIYMLCSGTAGTIRPSTMTTSALGGQPIVAPGVQTDTLTQALEQAAESAEKSVPMQVCMRGGGGGGVV